MRINVYAEEYPTDRRVELAKKTADTGRTFFGARIFLASPETLTTVTSTCSIAANSSISKSRNGSRSSAG